MAVAQSLVADFGNAAETKVDLNIADCMEARCMGMARIWKEVRTAIAQIRTNEGFG